MLRVFRSITTALAVVSIAVPAVAEDIALRNWTVPNHGAKHEGITALGDLTNGSVFIGVQPCRVVDTRNPAGPFGGPMMTSGTTRLFDIDAGSCTGIPNPAAAFSLNISVTETAGQGYLTAWPADQMQPTVATMTWFGANQTLSNAAIVPAGLGGHINVFVAASTHLIIDINGYFMDGRSYFNGGTYLKFLGNNTDAFMYVANSNSTTNVDVIRAELLGNGEGSSAIEGVVGAPTAIQYGIYGRAGSETEGAAGVYGETTIAGGKAGVRGKIVGDCSNCGGVVGVDKQRPNLGLTTYTSAAVAGWSGGSVGVGVMGVSDYIGVFGSAKNSSGVTQSEGYLGWGADGVYAAGNLTATGTKAFLEPHPSDPAKVIKYVALEGPEAGTYFRGTTRTSGGVAVIDVPENFRIVTDEDGLTVQLTAIGAPATIWVVTRDLNRIVVRSSRDVTFDYQVNGVRRAFRDFQPVVEADDFVPKSADDTLPTTLPEESRQRLISNGTYNQDGTVNEETASRMGWDRSWRQREQQRR